MTFPIPNAALDDRHGFIGTSGSGKTYNASGAVERLLHRRARVVIVDPLGVWWGLRLLADGKTASQFDVAIFGGPRGDLPLNEHAGALIGETAATMAESCIIDLRELGSKAAERRFMTAFLETIYRKAGGEPFHLVVDEADLFAPQKPSSGDEVLLGLMENIVRRGRVKGFIPWLISQRPAVLNKNVLSQVDGLIAFKLTSTQDRDALDAWIEGQADKAKGKEIKDALPTMKIGEGVVWLPGHGILQTKQFPRKETFDSSRAPKRGEKATRTAALKPLDLGALKTKLATVEAAERANDPRALRSEINRLNKELLHHERKPTMDPEAIKKAEAVAYRRGEADTAPVWFRRGVEAVMKNIKGYVDEFELLWFVAKEMKTWKDIGAVPKVEASSTPSVPRQIASRAKPADAPPAPKANGSGDSLSGPQLQLLRALAWWDQMGNKRPTRVQVASICGWRITSGHLKNVCGSLRTLGLIDYPNEGTIALTDEGAQVAPEPDTSASLLESVREILTGPQRQAFDVLPADGKALSRDQLAEACGWNVTSGHVKNVLGSMRSLEVIEYPSQGTVSRADWLQEAS
jgi:uncharacterized protein